MALARMRCLPGPEAAKEDRTALLLIQRLMLGFEIGPDWRGDDALDRLHDWFQNEAPGPITSAALLEEAYSDGGRKPRAGADLTEPRFKAESDNWCKAKDKFNGLVSSVQLSAGDNAEDTGLVESLSERGVAGLSVEEIGALLEAKRRLAASAEGSTRAKKLGLFEPVDLGTPTEPADSSKQIAIPEPAIVSAAVLEPAENSMMAILRQMQEDNRLMREDISGLKGEERVQFDDQCDQRMEEGPASEEAGLQQRLLAAVMTGGASKSVCKMGASAIERAADDKIDRLHKTLTRDKIDVPQGEHEMQFNFTLEEYCGLEVRLVRLDALASVGGLSAEMANNMRAKEEAVHHDIQGLRRKRDVLWDVVKLKRRGDSEVATEMYRLFLEEERGYLLNPDVERLRKKAKLEVKQSEGLRTVKTMESMMRCQQQGLEQQKQVAARLERFTGAGHDHSGGNRSGGSNRFGGGAEDLPRQRDRRMRVTDNQTSFQMKYVSGAVYGIDADVQAPEPAMFPVKRADYHMDAPGGGIHYDKRPTKFNCGFCNAVGHQASECPPREWHKGGVKFVNFRWLFKEGKCDGKGQPL